MSDVVYISKSRIERKQGPVRIAYLPGESQPVIFSVHGAIAEHYKVNPATLKYSHSSTIDSACDRWCKAQPAGAVPALVLTAVFSQLRHDTVDDWVGDTVR